MPPYRVIILSGISGSGKSTYIAKHLPDALVVSADHFFMTDRGEYDFDRSKLKEAHATCLRKFIAAVQGDGRADGDGTIVVDNTCTTVAEIAPYAAIADAYGCGLEIVTLRCAPTVAASRNKHDVPSEVIHTQWRRLQERELPSWWATTDVQT